MATDTCPIFRGISTALVTPFKDGRPDLNAFARLIDVQLESGVASITVCGTTGEASTLSESEQARLIKFAAKRVKGQIPIIAGGGSNCTKKAVELSRHAEDMGADALLIVTPYYNKATPDGLIQHYTAIADAVSLPIILYNVPSRTCVDIPLEVCAELSHHPNIVGIKEASTSPDKARKIIESGIPLHIFSGNDMGLCDMLELGAAGCISVAANIIPRDMVRLCDLYFSEDQSAARQLEVRLTPLFSALFCQVNPIPTKFALKLMGLCSEEMRLPLCPPSDYYRGIIEDALKSHGLI